ncbi:peptidoglycan-binding domain-containing protein [Agaricicola taiwanensis]|uniref:peptidoglycan-binding domain-containing protein n=1 Tax=Agaricicola taiwanensis TaxID=591372 RepID=UPI001E646EA0|nr:peptidoglycan-binding protein [Agaricicola taiwanensis]
MASAVAAATAIAIVVNALALQNGTHPAPIFSPSAAAPTPAVPAVPMPPQRQTHVSGPAATATPPAVPAITGSAGPSQKDVLLGVQAELARLGRYDGPVDGLYGPKTEFAIREYERATGKAPTGEASQNMLEALKATRVPTATPSPRGGEASATPAASAAAASSNRILTIQRVLAEQGYGPIKLDGVVGEETKAAIFRFEIHRNLPPTGELSPRFVRELSAISGVPLQ